MEIRRKVIAASVFGLPIAVWLLAGWSERLPAWSWLTLGLPLCLYLWWLAKAWESPSERRLRQWLRQHPRQPRPPSLHPLYRFPSSNGSSAPPDGRTVGRRSG